MGHPGGLWLLRGVRRSHQAGHLWPLVLCELTEVRNCGWCTVGMESFLEEKNLLAPSSLLHRAVCSQLIRASMATFSAAQRWGFGGSLDTLVGAETS